MVGAIVLVLLGAFAFGVDLSVLAIFGLLFICPLAMFFMMRGMAAMGDDAQTSSGHQQHTHHGNNTPR